MTDEELARLEALAQAATPGPWKSCGASEGQCSCCVVWSIPADYPVLRAVNEDDGPGRWQDSAFAAAARDAVPALVAEVRRLRGIQATWEGLAEGYLSRAQAAEAERDALRAESERLHRELGGWRGIANAHADSLVDRDAEATELRASLADAVAKFALLEPVCTEALARRRAFHARHQDEEGAWEEYDRAREAFGTALDRYEASLPSIAKDTP